MTDIAAPRGGSPGCVDRRAASAAGAPALAARWSTPARVRGGALAAVVLAMAVATLTASLFGQLHGEFSAMGQTGEPGRSRPPACTSTSRTWTGPARTCCSSAATPR